MFTMSVADLLDDYFEHDALKGSIASTGVVGVWAGPNTPGTAYNLLHHALGELNGVKGSWGHVVGGMGAISEAIAASARAAGAEIRTDAEVASIDVEGERVVGVTLADGERLRAPVVASGAHPKTTILDLAGAENFPEEVVADMRRYRTRGGSVKINMVLSEPPRYEGVERGDAGGAAPHRRQPLPLGRVPGAGLAGRARRPPGGRTVRRVRAALGDRLEPDRRRHLGDDDVHPVRAADEAGWPRGRAREATPTPASSTWPVTRPTCPDAIIEREVLAPPDLERIFGLTGGSIFQGEQGLDQMAFMRPSPLLSGYATPVHGLYLCGAGTHPGGGVMAASGHNAAKRILRDGRMRRVRRRVRSA